MKTKNISQGWRLMLLHHLQDDSVSIKISLDVTLGGDQVASLDAEQIEENVDLVAMEGTKKNPQKLIVKKRGSQIGESDQLKLNVVILHDVIGKEIHKTHPVVFTADLKIIDLVA